VPIASLIDYLEASCTGLALALHCFKAVHTVRLEERLQLGNIVHLPWWGLSVIEW
jgi:hypothetical protein